MYSWLVWQHYDLCFALTPWCYSYNYTLTWLALHVSCCLFPIKHIPVIRFKLCTFLPRTARSCTFEVHAKRTSPPANHPLQKYKLLLTDILYLMINDLIFDFPDHGSNRRDHRLATFRTAMLSSVPFQITICCPHAMCWLRLFVSL